MTSEEYDLLKLLRKRHQHAELRPYGFDDFEVWSAGGHYSELLGCGRTRLAALKHALEGKDG